MQNQSFWGRPSTLIPLRKYSSKNTPGTPLSFLSANSSGGDSGLSIEDIQEGGRTTTFFFFNSFIYLFLAVLVLRFCARAFSSCGERGPLFIAVRGPLTVTASHCGAQLQTRRLSSHGAWAQLLRGMWDPPGPGLEPVSPASAGRFSTTAPPGKPHHHLLKGRMLKVRHKSWSCSMD